MARDLDICHQTIADPGDPLLHARDRAGGGRAVLLDRRDTRVLDERELGRSLRRRDLRHHGVQHGGTSTLGHGYFAGFPAAELPPNQQPVVNGRLLRRRRGVEVRLQHLGHTPMNGLRRDDQQRTSRARGHSTQPSLVGTQGDTEHPEELVLILGRHRVGP